MTSLLARGARGTAASQPYKQSIPAYFTAGRAMAAQQRPHHPAQSSQPPSLHQRRHLTAPYGYEQAKALVYSTHGEPRDVLRLHTHSLSPPHSNLLTAQLLASPLNPADINTLQGTYPSTPPFTTHLSTSTPSAVPGNEGLARVLAHAPGTRMPTPTLADPHATSPARPGDWLIMRAPAAGTWRTHIQAPGSAFLKLSEEDTDGITPVQAATVGVNPCTAYAMLRGYVGAGAAAPRAEERLRPGDWFAQNGANSGVGRAAVQLGRAWGLRSVNVVRARPEGEEATGRLKEELRGLGADVVVTEEEAGAKEFPGRLREEFGVDGEAGIRLGLNCVGGRSALSLAKVLGRGASLVTYGAMAKQPVSVPAGMLIFKDVRFVGFWVSEWSRNWPGEKMEAVREVFRLTREGKFRDGSWRECSWDWGTREEELKGMVQSTMEGFRGGKGVFVFGDT